MGPGRYRVAAVAGAFFELSDGRLVPSELTRGPWDPGAQHAGPPSALIGRALERCEPREGMRIGRVTIDILGPVPLEPLSVEARVVRPGRSVELLSATLAGPDGDLMRASAWRVLAGDMSVDNDDPPPPGPEHGGESDFFPTGMDVGYHTAMEYSFIEGGFLERGPATVWMRQRGPLVEGEEPTALERLLVVADVGNGVSAVLDWREHLFINTELTVHLLRPPEGEWIGVDATTRVDGVGLAESVLYDQRGRVGRGAQTLLVRPRA
jgi:acyl-Coa thioesterase superfamily protein/acyl-CoA thioesterase superfamily protein